MIKDYDLTVAELFESYYDCRKHKRNKPSAILFEQSLESNLMELYYELRDGLWNPSSLTVFAITKPKPREVWAADFRDRIVHHLMYRAIGPQFERSFIADSCACIKGRGTLYASNRLSKHLLSATENWSKDGYILKIDVANFFGSIRQDILFNLIRKRVSNYFLLNIIEKIIFQNVKENSIFSGDKGKLLKVPPHKSLFNAAPGIGLPIGNLSSQFFANIYLDVIDQAVKRKYGIKHYVRYVDDMVFVDPSKDTLNAVLEGVQYELDFIGLKLAHSKTQIVPSRYGIDFVGSVLRPYRKEWRRKTFNTAIHSIRNSEKPNRDKSATSYLGLCQTAGNRAQKITIAKVCRQRNMRVNPTITRVFYADQVHLRRRQHTPPHERGAMCLWPYPARRSGYCR